LGQGIFVNDVCIAQAEVVTVAFDPKSNSSKKLSPELRDILEGASLRA